MGDQPVKQIFLIFSLMVGVSAFAHPVVSTSASLYCRLTADSRYPLLAGESLGIRIAGQEFSLSRTRTEEFLFSRLTGWVDTLRINGDPVFAETRKPLCVGMYDDSRGANAVAIGEGQIAYGAVLAAQAQRDFGAEADYAVTYIAAHEFAHILQHRLGLRFDYGTPGARLDLLSSKVKELHADCMAGYLLEMHHQVPFDRQDLVDRYVRALGDAHAVGDHGLPADRVAATKEGARMAHLDRVVGIRDLQAVGLSARCGLKYRPQSF